MTYPGSDTKIPTEKAVVSWIQAITTGLNDVLTTGSFIVTGTNQVRFTQSGDRASMQYLSGVTWIEQSYMPTSNITNKYIPYWNGTALADSNMLISG